LYSSVLENRTTMNPKKKPEGPFEIPVPEANPEIVPSPEPEEPVLPGGDPETIPEVKPVNPSPVENPE
jgi:hypothetical protein